MRFLTLLSLLTLSFFGISCSNNATKEVQLIDLKELIVDTLYLEKDTLTKELGTNFNYIKRGGEEFLITSRQHRFIEYSYPEGKLMRDQFYEKEGPDGIGSFLPVSFTDDSSVWFVSFQKLIQADQKGKVLARYNLPAEPTDRFAVNYNTLAGTKAMNVDGRIMIPDVPFVLKESLLNYENWLLKFNPKDSSINYVKFKYPSKYLEFLDDPTFATYQNGYNKAEDLHLISFPADDSLLVISPNSQKWVFAGVNDQMEFLVGRTAQQGEYTAFLPNENTSKYSWVDYDPTAQVYLREAIIRADSKANREEGIRPLSKLVILDRDFEKIGEVTLPDLTRGFSTPDGYYLYLGYPHSEDEVAFGKLDFSKINPRK
ncbi:DUF4221 domain-containing protein [Algoriphagus halophytocola]|uniref:DUF4221 domain-containing protein n=1 Tax=Algoriphagus halophytocola TaxID=2991499 RepID=A0ABY6MGX0_9BACT|nr:MULTISPECIES: DUF4221 domain-containing protein [unclassified Algoriphagus]UZD21444.1 DUF4221 domain-containing protein [Algoriphagus sp. TR-M5]WBL42656.1 DUF4221 domain-containing protein [Algoriphagus sp. TR-M9]